MISIIVGSACLFLGLMILIVVGILAARSFLKKAKSRGVNVLDGIDAEELGEMARIFSELRKAEMRIGLQSKLSKVVAAPVPEVAPLAPPSPVPAAAAAVAKAPVA